MDPKDALLLDNWFCRPTYLELRSGAVTWATGLPTLPQSLIQWNGPTGTGKLFAGTSAGIFDVTIGGAVGASVFASTSGKYQWVNYAVGSGAEFLLAANGKDTLQTFDGTAWANSTITGPTLANIVQLNIFKQRVFLIEINKLSFWYLPVSAYTGAAVEFPLNQIFARGGYCVAMATWSLDAGAGLDDLGVFITSEGELAVFRGTNPGDPANWSLIGVWYVGKPLGRRCFKKYKGDMLLILQNGVFPLSWALLSAAIGRQRAVTNKIQMSFTSAAASFGNVFGWEIEIFPQQDMMLVNVPNAEGGVHQQYVMNTQSQAWSSFSGWNAECFTVFGGNLYYGSGTSIVQAWNGIADPGTVDVVGNVKTAFNFFRDRGRIKKINLIRPIMVTSGPITFLAGTNTDFTDQPPTSTILSNPAQGSLWDTGLWDSAQWGYGQAAQLRWDSIPGKPGRCHALVMRVATHSVTVQWPGTDFILETGGRL
jgi:hypothetical protein